MKHCDLHPEDLIDRERAGELDSDGIEHLSRHREHCVSCEWEARLVEDFELERNLQPIDHVTARSAVDALLGSLDDDESAPPEVSSLEEETPSRRALWTSRSVLFALAAASVFVVGVASAARLDMLRPVLQVLSFSPPIEETLEPVELTPRVEKRHSPKRSGPASENARQVREIEVIPVQPSEPVEEPSELAPPTPVVRVEVPKAPPRRIVPSASTLLSDANRARRAGHHGAAAELYRRLQELHPESRAGRTSQVSLGNLYLQELDAPERALQSFESYIAVQPDGVMAEEALVGRAKALRALDRRAEEAETWELLLAKFPNSLHASVGRARLEALR